METILIYGKSTTYKQTIDPEFAATFPPGFPTMDKLILVSQAYEPPFSFPVDMKPGQVASQKSTITKTKVFDGRIDPATSIPATGELTITAARSWKRHWARSTLASSR